MKVSIIFVVFALLCINACTAVNLNAIPSPHPSAKLRVFVLALTESDPPGKIWATSQQQFSENMSLGTAKVLEETGIYDVVPKEDLWSVLGSQTFMGWQWLRTDMSLVKQVGRALYADYAMIVMRGYRANFELNIVFVNLETGVKYTASGSIPMMISSTWVLTEYRKMIRNYYRKIFYDAKSDMLATAIHKGRLMPREEIKKPAVPETTLALAPPSVSHAAPVPPRVTAEEKTSQITERLPIPIPAVSRPSEEVKVSQLKPPAIKKDTETPEVIAKISPAPPPDLPAEDKREDFEQKLEDELHGKAPAKNKTRLVVYDFAATERLNVVALILSEALREELFTLGRFSLVNRENLQQVMQELKLQHSGLIDEGQIVELGKWFAANEAVTGRLAVLGNSYVLQAKRTDVKTLGTLGLGSLKCMAGQEEDLLTGMPALAKKLIGLKN